MARKKIIGQSKLSVSNAPANATEDLKLVTKRPQLKPTSFRLNPEDKERLKNLVAQVNELSPNKKISETMVIKALIFQGLKAKPDKIIQAIREVMF